MIKSTKSLRIVEQYTDWRDFYTRPDLAFKYLVEALEVDVKAIKRKIRPKKSAFEEADPADKVEAVEDADTVKVDL